MKYVLNQKQKERLYLEISELIDKEELNEEIYITNNLEWCEIRTEKEDTIFPYCVIVGGNYVDSITKDYFNELVKLSDTIFNYVVVQYADEWYEEHKGIVFHTYKDTKDYLIKNKLTTLLNKLDYLESIKHQMFVYDNNKVDLVVSYC